MATKIPNPPGKTYCDWCRKPLEWKDGQFAESEYLCPACWPEWLAIIADKDEDDHGT